MSIEQTKGQIIADLTKRIEQTVRDEIKARIEVDKAIANVQEIDSKLSKLKERLQSELSNLKEIE